MNIITLDSKFSTTRRVTNKQPDIENNSDDNQLQNLLFLPPNPQRKEEGGLRKMGYFKCPGRVTKVITLENKFADIKSLTNTSANSDNYLNSQLNPSELPLVTIITVIFNGDKHLEETIQSIINQTYDNVEYIIIDGGSTDKTLDIIYQYKNQIDYWISEPDKGIYDAMNKGIQLSQGELIGLLNSGDLYTNGAIEEVVKLYNMNKNNHENLIITGGMYRCDDKGNPLFKLVKTQKDLEVNVHRFMPINHPATFVSRKTYETIGYFNSEFKICGDYDFIFRSYYSYLVKFIFTDSELAYMRLDGVSEKFKSLQIRSFEQFIIRKQKIVFLTNFLFSIRWLSIKLTKYLIKSMLGEKIIFIYYTKFHNKLSKHM